LEDPDVVTAVENEDDAFDAYPNPFSSELYIDGVEALFINSLGQVAMRSNVQKEEAINTLGLPAGLYVVRIVAEDHSSKTVKLKKN
jgi:hypothetical protein